MYYHACRYVRTCGVVTGGMYFSFCLVTGKRIRTNHKHLRNGQIISVLVWFFSCVLSRFLVTLQNPLSRVQPQMWGSTIRPNQIEVVNRNKKDSFLSPNLSLLLWLDRHSAFSPNIRPYLYRQDKKAKSTLTTDLKRLEEQWTASLQKDIDSHTQEPLGDCDGDESCYPYVNAKSLGAVGRLV